ncbi:DUF742 domain-containing protein [Actinomadura rugatobispora]|uniref:DUF742 domain-containing protein n=1 Tax=Actinomadura rugatobispora TaxID=1994 RepID=A0ABW0ZX18_9ACTN|nr:DUF742 domain-containing protein [Actinomadura rugatobispora]
MDTPRERRPDADTGPFVRPYAFTRGRARAQGIRLDLITMLVATGRSPGERARPSYEQRLILERCRAPVALADLTSELDLPLGVVHVLLSDLLQQGLLEEQRSAPLAERPSPEILQRVLDDLRAL